MIKVDDLIKQLEKYRGGTVEKIGIVLYNGTCFDIPVNNENTEIYIDKAWCECEEDKENDIEIVIK